LGKTVQLKKLYSLKIISLTSTRKRKSLQYVNSKQKRYCWTERTYQKSTRLNQTIKANSWFHSNPS
jgi:hypothetical protein